MLPGMKQKFDLYFHSIVDVTNQAMNNPKTSAILGPSLMGFGLADINNALGTISGIIGIIVTSAAFWVMLEKRSHDKRRRKEGEMARKKDAELTRLKIQKLKLENSALESHIKKR
jgi:hypothetical protein